MPSSWPPIARPCSIPCAPARWRGSDPPRCASATASIPNRCPSSSPGVSGNKSGHDEGKGGQTKRRSIKIASFNVNDVNKRLPNLLAWLKRSRPDVACLQELKSTDAGFPQAALAREGYRAISVGERTYNGVAILGRTEPHATRNTLPGDPDDAQSRYLEAAVSGVLVTSI